MLQDKPSQVLIAALVALTLAFEFVNTSDGIVDGINNQINRVSWKTDLSRNDLYFTTGRSTFVNRTINHPTNNCLGYHACLIKDNQTVIATYKQDKLEPNVITFSSQNDNKDLTTTAKKYGCSLKVETYCSTHWMPPTIKGRIGCSVIVELHAPLYCDVKHTNHQVPCFAYNNQGQLIDLTRLIHSNGSDYSVKVYPEGKNSSSIIRFNVCNEASVSCGHGVAACYNDNSSSSEIGYLNQTSLRFDEKTEQVILKYIGTSTSTCKNGTSTQINFVCKEHNHLDPSHYDEDSCNHVLIWDTIYACPVETFTKPFNECPVKFPHEFNFDLLKVFNGTPLSLNNFDGEGSSFKFSVCGGMNSSCGSKSTKTTTACLTHTVNGSLTSEIFGSLGESNMVIVNDRLMLDYKPHSAKTCVVNSDKYSLSKVSHYGARIELICEKDAPLDAPRYIGFNDCIYTFEWPMKNICNEYSSTESIKLNETQIATTSLAPKITKKNEFTSPRLVTTKSLEDKRQQISNNTLVPGMRIPISKEEKLEKNEPIENNTRDWKESAQKFILVFLICISFVGFALGMIILDKKTQFSRPLRQMRGKLHHHDAPKPVPYSRMNQYNDFLDL